MPETTRRWPGLVVTVVLAVAGLTHASYILETLYPAVGSPAEAPGAVPGGDFLVFYNAAVMTAKGSAGFIWDRAAFDAHLAELFGRRISGLNFFYPPIALLVLLPLALFSFLHALWLWTGLSLIALGWCIYRLTRHWPATALSMISPLTIHSAGSGQTGTLFAVLLALVLLNQNHNPARAGSYASLFAIKPHLALALPLYLLAERNWRALAGMVICLAALALTVTALFGFQVWISFLQSIGTHSTEAFRGDALIHDRSLSFLHLALRLGSTGAAAWSIQLLISLTAALILLAVWRSTTDPMLRYFAIALAMCLMTPKVLHYDAVVLVIPIALLIVRLEQGTADLGLVLLAITIWFLPLLVPVFRIIGFNPGGAVLFVGLVMVWAKSRHPNNHAG